MNRTTVYLPDDMKLAIERLAMAEGTSEAAVIRSAVADRITRARPPLEYGFGSSGDGSGSLHVDELLAGFGDR